MNIKKFLLESLEEASRFLLVAAFVIAILQGVFKWHVKVSQFAVNDKVTDCKEAKKLMEETQCGDEK